MAEDKRLALLRAIARAQLGATDLMEGVEAAYRLRGFETTDADTLFRGLVSEVGELGDVLNIFLSPVYKARPAKLEKANRLGLKEQVAHELGDVLTYTAALALHYGIVPRFRQWDDDRERAAETITPADSG